MAAARKQPEPLVLQCKRRIVNLQAEGAGVMKGPVMSSGHAMHVVTYADRCARLIESVDPQLDDRAYIENWYATSTIELPLKPKLKWAFLHLDLAVYESTKGTVFLVQKGWN